MACSKDWTNSLLNDVDNKENNCKSSALQEANWDSTSERERHFTPFLISSTAPLVRSPRNAVKELLGLLWVLSTDSR